MKCNNKIRKHQGTILIEQFHRKILPYQMKTLLSENQPIKEALEFRKVLFEDYKFRNKILNRILIQVILMIEREGKEVKMI